MNIPLSSIMRTGVRITSVIAVAITLWGCGSSPTTPATQAEKAPTTAPAASTPKTKPIIFKTVDEFQQRFNAMATENELEFQVRSIDIEEGSVNNTFEYHFNDHIGILGALNKADNSVISVTMIGTGDGTEASGANIIVMMLGLIATADPSIKPDDRPKLLKRMGMFTDENDVTNMDAHTVQNGLKYSISSSPTMGIWFSVSSANE